jgi:hypothetical protein
VGTFYGLTLSIAKLTALVAGDGGTAADLTQSLTLGLTEALSGMSVAFSTSLVGIVAAVVMTLFGVFSNLTDRRLALMVRIEHYVDHLMMADAGGDPGEARWAHTAGAAAAAGAGGRGAARTVDRFGQSVAALEAAVTRFEGALDGFSATTRDFREFNLHLKDNVQRMSLTFGDLSETLKDHVRALRSGGEPR